MVLQNNQHSYSQRSVETDVLNVVLATNTPLACARMCVCVYCILRQTNLPAINQPAVHRFIKVPLASTIA